MLCPPALAALTRRLVFTSNLLFFFHSSVALRPHPSFARLGSGMVIDDAVHPPIRRWARATLEAQQQQQQHTQDGAFVSDGTHEELGVDDAAPPPIASTPSASVHGRHYTEPTRHPPLSPTVNPLRLHPVDSTPHPTLTRKSSCLFRQVEAGHGPSPDPAPVVQPPTARRHARGLVSYRNNKREINNTKRLPPHLRRQTSLETIDSVTTSASDDQSECGHDMAEAEAPWSEWYTLEDDALGSRPPSVVSKPSSMHSASDSSGQSVTPVETRIEHASVEQHTPQSLFRKMIPRKLSDRLQEAPPGPARMVIEKSTTIDRCSYHVSPSASASSPSEEQRSVDSALDEAKRSQCSGSSKWSSSGYDTSMLSEGEMKRCQKKGINPALYAEMRAARKGKWASPIAGNSFL